MGQRNPRYWVIIMRKTAPIAAFSSIKYYILYDNNNNTCKCQLTKVKTTEKPYAKSIGKFITINNWAIW